MDPIQVSLKIHYVKYTEKVKEYSDLLLEQLALINAAKPLNALLLQMELSLLQKLKKLQYHRTLVKIVYKNRYIALYSGPMFEVKNATKCQADIEALEYVIQSICTIAELEEYHRTFFAPKLKDDVDKHVAKRQREAAQISLKNSMDN